MKRKCILMITVTSIILCSCGGESEPSTPKIGMMPIQHAPESESATYDGEIGRFIYYPYSTEELYAPCGTNEVCFYFEKDDIVPNAGYVNVFDSLTGAMYDTIDVSDEKRCKVNDFDEIAMQYTGWEEGSSVSVFFDKSFLPDSNYFLTLDKGCFMSADEMIYSREITEEDQLVFGIAAYGLNSIDTTLLENFVVGDSYNLGVILDGEADLAVVTDYDGRFLSLNETRIVDTDYFTLEFLQSGESSLTVTFYDAMGIILNTVSFKFTVI